MEIIRDRNNKEIAILKNDLISGWVKEHGELAHDKNSLPQILRYIKEGDIVIDAGAFIADHTVAYAKAVGETGQVWAFEPNPIALDALRFNTKDFPQIKVSDLALSFCGDKGKYSINYNDTNVGASFLSQKEKGTMFTTCVDHLGLDRLDLMKLDCEGFELNILRGAIETIFQHKPIIVLEINKGALEKLGHTPQMIFGLLDEMHYFYRNIYEEQEMGGEQYDIIAFPKNKK